MKALVLTLCTCLFVVLVPPRAVAQDAHLRSDGFWAGVQSGVLFFREVEGIFIEESDEAAFAFKIDVHYRYGQWDFGVGLMHAHAGTFRSVAEGVLGPIGAQVRVMGDIRWRYSQHTWGEPFVRFGAGGCMMTYSKALRQEVASNDRFFATTDDETLSPHTEQSFGTAIELGIGLDFFLSQWLTLGLETTAAVSYATFDEGRDEDFDFLIGMVNVSLAWSL